MSSDPVASVQGTCLVSTLNIPERRGKRKSTMETLSLLCEVREPSVPVILYSSCFINCS
jgi:hypothetical protein